MVYVYVYVFVYSYVWSGRVSSRVQDGSSPRFKQIAALYSELVAVSVDGRVHQWKWNEPLPYTHPEVRVTLLRCHYLTTVYTVHYITVQNNVPSQCLNL